MKSPLQLKPSPFQKWTALLFVLVMAGFGLVQAVHVHDELAGQASPTSHCSLCVVGHNAALITPASAAPAQVTDSAQIAVVQPRLQSHLHATSSFIRPPPQNL
jgi:hypothetical protein